MRFSEADAKAFLIAAALAGAGLSACATLPPAESLAIPQGRLSAANVRLLVVGRVINTFSHEYRLRDDGTFSATATIGGPPNFRGTYAVSGNGTLTLTPNPGVDWTVATLLIYREGDTFCSWAAAEPLTAEGACRFFNHVE